MTRVTRLASGEWAEGKETRQQNLPTASRLSALLGIVPDGIVAVDQDQCIVVFNHGAEEIFGYRAEEVLGQPLDLLLPSRFVESHRRHLSDFDAATEITRYMDRRPEIVGRRKDGTEFPAEASISKLVQEGQTLFAVILRDITDRKWRLHEVTLLLDLSAELRTRVRLDEMPTPILDHVTAGLNADGAVIFTIDPRTNQLQVHAGRGEFEGLAECDYPLAAMPVGCGMRTGAICTGQEECPFLPRAGRPLQVACVPFKIGDQIPGGLAVGTQRDAGWNAEELRLLTGIADITANAMRRAALLDELRLYKDAFESTVDAVMITDLGTRILDINPAFERLTGFTRQEALGHKPSLVKSAHTTPEFYKQMWAQILAQGYWAGEIINQHKDGAEWNAWLTISSVKDARGVPVAYVGINRDITELKSLQRERETLLAAAQRRVAELTVLNAVALAATEAPDENALIERVTQIIGETLYPDNFGVLLLDQAAGVLHVHPSYRARQEGWRWTIPLGVGIAGHVAVSGQPLRVPDVSREPRYLVGDPSARSEMCVPLKVDGRVIGVINTGSNRLDAFSAADERLLTTVAGQLVTALEKLRLFEAERQQRQLAEALGDTAAALTSTLNFEEVLDRILANTGRVVPHDSANIMLVASGIARIVRRRGYVEYKPATGAPPPSVEFALAEMPSLRVMLETGQPLIIADTQADPRWVDRLWTRWVRAYAGAPIRLKGQVIGFINLNSTVPRFFTQTHAERLLAFADQAGVAIENARLFNDLQRSSADLALAYDATIEGWSRALDLRDRETEGHTQRVTEMTLRLAEAMDMSVEELVQMRRGALLHDIGKMGVPDSILLKPAALTTAEWEIMRRHPTFAYEMLAPIAYLHPALDIPFCHHERWDGTGYPRGLKGIEIPLAARIFAVVDVWDALRSDRPYRNGWHEDKVREYLQAQAGKQLDPQVVEVFLRLLERVIK